MRIATVQMPVKQETGNVQKELVEVRWWSQKDHPFWSLAKPIAYALALGIILQMTANHFDSGEIKAMVGTFVAGVVFEGFGIKKR